MIDTEQWNSLQEKRNEDGRTAGTREKRKEKFPATTRTYGVSDEKKNMVREMEGRILNILFTVL